MASKCSFRSHLLGVHNLWIMYSKENQPHSTHSTLTSYGVERLLRPKGVQVTQTHCFFSLCPSVFSVVFQTIPEDNKKSLNQRLKKWLKRGCSAMQAAASWSGGIPPWLLKYIIYVITHRKGRKIRVTSSLRPLRSLRWKINFQSVFGKMMKQRAYETKNEGCAPRLECAECMRTYR